METSEVYVKNILIGQIIEHREYGMCMRMKPHIDDTQRYFWFIILEGTRAGEKFGLSPNELARLTDLNLKKVFDTYIALE